MSRLIDDCFVVMQEDKLVIKIRARVTNNAGLFIGSISIVRLSVLGFYSAMSIVGRLLCAAFFKLDILPCVMMQCYRLSTLGSFFISR